MVKIALPRNRTPTGRSTHEREALMIDSTEHKTKGQRFWREYRATFLFLFLMFMFRSAWADWMSVPTGSMNPTIIEGDRILVDKHVYGLRLPWTLVRLTDGRDPQRGEIVVFDSPADGISLVKRLVGVPGDVIAIDQRGLVINGKYADYAPGDASLIDSLPASTQAQQPAVFRESGVLPSHNMLRMPVASPRQYFGPVVVPDGMYLVLGDNRDNSADSRYIGFVPRKNIVGLTSRVAVSFDPDDYYLPRRKRWFKPLD
jgi:signal peptidase I